MKIPLLGFFLFISFSQAQAAFRHAILSDRVIIDLRLQTVDSNPDFSDISYQAYRSLGRRTEDGGPASEFIDVEFPSLNKKQFDFLKATYGFNQSKVIYRSGEPYNLTDFLPPDLQAIVNTYYVPETGKEDSGFLGTNCWGTALSYLRQRLGQTNQVTLFYGIQTEFRAFMDSTDLFDKILQPRFLDQIDNPGAQFGDLILHRLKSSGRYIDHVSIYVDKELYFEKVGPDADQPTRLVSFPSFEVTGRGYYDYRRINADSIPHPKEIFKSRTLLNPDNSLSFFPAEIVYAEIPLKYDPRGRAFLPKRYFSPHWGTEVTDATFSGVPTPK